jgi:hypothetical protein
MNATARALAGFGLGFAVYYAIAFEYNCCWLPAFTYYPAVNEFIWGFGTGNDEIGPPMHWYGWMVNAVWAGLVLGGVAALLPASLTAKAWSILVWAGPLAAMAFMVHADWLFFAGLF